MTEKTNFITGPELAEKLGISRIAVFKKIKKGQIKAMKIGKVWAIPADFRIPTPLKKYRSQKYHESPKQPDFKQKSRKIKKTADVVQVKRSDYFLDSMGWD
ncbi:MAG: helix-turn-helix domain-containing protein [Elusimicrobia bacterium]|nr:helix-turn-helix domain-containing protein [Elusimicrobiota bacterium]